MTAARASFAADYLERSLGLVSGSLRPGTVPSELARDLTSVMRGSPPEDGETPSLEARVAAFLEELEASALDEDGFFVRKARWPGAARLAVCLTHDVDNIERPLDHMLKTRERFSRADFQKARKGLLSLYDNVDLIAGKEAAAGFRSSFYFLSDNYPLSRVRRSAARLESGGWEVGLHGDFGTHDSRDRMTEAVDRLRRGLGIRPRGLREHYLRFDFSRSWEVFQEAGFDYDTTVGNSDVLGFKLGLATPFHPPDDGWRPMRILELPLSLMDTTLWGYLKRGEAEGLGDVERSMAMVERVEGLFTLLWHQEAVRMKGGRIYWKLLERLRRRRNLFVGSGRDIARWWRAREVALERRGWAFTLGGAPPQGLALVVKRKRGMRLRVSSGRVSTRRGQTLVVPASARFKLEFSGGWGER